MLKYKAEDVIKMIDVFNELLEKGVDGVPEAMEKLTQYPTDVILTFLEGIKALNPNIDKDNYWGTIGYITMKINLVNVKPEVINTI